jgi:hypothetical protein
MKKRRSEIWMEVMEQVTTVTEITQNMIFSGSKKSDVSQARGLFFLTLTKQGLRPATIMRLCKSQGWESIVYSTITKHLKRANTKVLEDEEFIEFLSEIEENLAPVSE